MSHFSHPLRTLLLVLFIGGLSTCKTCVGDQTGVGAGSESETEAHVKSIAESTNIVDLDGFRSAVGSSADDWPALVARVRPSVVLIRTPFGSGTGFVFGDGRLKLKDRIIP